MNDAILDVRPALLSDAAAIMVEAAQWLAARGETLWKVEDLTVEKLAAHCAAHEVFVGYRANVGVVAALVQDRDPAVWPEVTDSLIVHKLSVRRAAAGQGVAAQMITWTLRYARERGMKFVRLDTAADRPKLRQFYERCGFRQVGQRRLGNFDLALYEKAV